MIEKVVITIFEVGKGDAAVFEIFDSSQVYYIVYDICKRGKSNPILDFLAKKTDTIHAVIISHFHRDHISGVSELFSKFNIEELYIPPYFHNRTDKINPILEKYRKEILDKSELITDETELEKLTDFSLIIHEVKKRSKLGSSSYVNSLEGVEVPFYLNCYGIELGKVLLPMKKFDQKIIQLIDSSKNKLDVFSSINDSSIAILFSFLGLKLLFCGDSEKISWHILKGKMRNRKPDKLQIDFLKIAHHGSKYNTDAEILNFFFDKEKTGPKYVAISGDGNKHPAKELLADIEELQLLPFCTNLSKHCVPKIKSLVSANISNYFTEFLANYDIVSTNPCQGNITVCIENNSLTVESELNNFCPYRFDTQGLV